MEGSFNLLFAGISAYSIIYRGTEKNTEAVTGGSHKVSVQFKCSLQSLLQGHFPVHYGQTTEYKL